MNDSSGDQSGGWELETITDSWRKAATNTSKELSLTAEQKIEGKKHVYYLFLRVFKWAQL